MPCDVHASIALLLNVANLCWQAWYNNKLMTIACCLHTVILGKTNARAMSMLRLPYYYAAIIVILQLIL